MTPEEQQAEQQAYIMYLLQSLGIDPASMGLSMGTAPQEPTTDQARNLTYRDNYNDLLVDPITRAQAGSGAFDYSTFQPTVTDEPVVREGEQLLKYYLSRADGTWEKILAEEIDAGGSAGSAFGIINQIVSNEPTTPQGASLKQSILDSVPPRMDFTTGESLGPDLEIVYKAAQDLEQKVALDPTGSYVDEQGRHFNRTEVPSEAAKFWTDKGLPTPDKRYDWRMLTGADGDLTLDDMIARANADKNIEGLGADYTKKKTASDQAMMKQLLKVGWGGGGKQVEQGPTPPSNATMVTPNHGVITRDKVLPGMPDLQDIGLGDFAASGVLNAVVPGAGLAQGAKGLWDRLQKFGQPGQPFGPRPYTFDNERGVNLSQDQIMALQPGGMTPSSVAEPGAAPDSGFSAKGYTFDNERGVNLGQDQIMALQPGGMSPSNVAGGGGSGSQMQFSIAAKQAAQKRLQEALLQRDQTLLPAARAAGEAAGRAAQANRSGRTPLIDALLAARMQGYLTGR